MPGINVTAADLRIDRLGEANIRSPMADLIEYRGINRHLSPDVDRLLFYDTVRGARQAIDDDNGDPPAFELAGPRQQLYFEPAQTRVGIVTCGGLCPGLNDVIRGLVMVLHHRYGVTQVEGYRHGYAGLNPENGYEPMPLTPSRVAEIHTDGGTILGTSRGPQDLDTMVDFLQKRKINVLFTIGGDGTLRGALALSQEARRRGADIAVIGIPKTIDNDILFIEQSFGFQTAFTRAVDAINSAHTESLAAVNGIGLVKLMGRHSGFIAAYATIACNDVNYTLIPEIPFPLEGEDGLLAHLDDRIKRRGHAVIVVAEGAGSHHLATSGERDKSGNIRLPDVGEWLKAKIDVHLTDNGIDHSIKYIDPSYMIRSCPANPHDSVYCFRLAANAVHAAMAGFTKMIVGRWHGRYIHLPIDLAVRKRQEVNPNGDLWQSVLESTGQPRWMPDAFSNGEPTPQ